MAQTVKTSKSEKHIERGCPPCPGHSLSRFPHTAHHVTTHAIRGASRTARMCGPDVRRGGASVTLLRAFTAHAQS